MKARSQGKRAEHTARRTSRLSFAFGFVSLLVAQTTWAWPNLAVVKTGPAQAAPGDLISYTLAYSNSGPVSGVNVALKDFLPSYVTVLTNTLSGGTLSGSTITWNLGTLASRAGGSRSFQVRVSTNTPSGIYITNRSQIFGTEAEEPGKTNNNYSTLITKISGPPPDFCRAILAKQPISLHGTMVIDSFNSRDPNFSTSGRYDPNKRGDGGHVASISDSLTVITDTGNTKVYGRFETGPLGTVRITGNASVGSLAWVDGGNRGIEPGWYLTNLNVVIPDAILPALTFTTLPQNSGTVGGTNYTYVLNSGNYSRSTDLTLSSSQKMVINGNVSLYLQKKLSISGQAYIYITPGSKLTVYLADTTSLAGGGTVNGTGFGTNCAYVGLPSCTSISFSGNSDYIGTVYASQATVHMSGGGSQVVNFIGSVVANDVNVTGNYQFHYDQGLCAECLPPTVLDAPVSLTNCPGTTASFSVSARGSSLNYAWFKENVALAAQTNSTLTIPNVTATNAGTYRVVVSVLCGDAVTNSATLTVNTPLGATALVSLTRTTGGSATFTTVASGTGPFSYVWKKNDSIIPGQTGSSLIVSNISRGDAGTYSVEVSGACGSVVRTATLTFLNTPPVAVNDSYTTPEDTTLTIAAPGVLGNDSDPDGDALKAILVSGPTHGTLTLNTNGGFGYTPTNNYIGSDSFTYRANDGTANSGIATASITVTPMNDTPVAVNDNYTTPEDTTLNVAPPGVLSNDSDPDGNALKAMLVSGPLRGTLTLNTNGGFSYTPTNHYVGGDSFTYRANDGTANSGVATVTITVTPVNDRPVVNNDAYTTPEDTTLNIPAPGVLANDSDADGDTLTAIRTSSPTHGTLTFSTNGSFIYVPAAQFNGTDSFTYWALDGTTNSTGIATVTITVTPLNDRPVANNDAYTTPEDTTLNIPAPGVLANDSDADGDTLTAMRTSSPTHGTLTFSTNGSFIYVPAAHFNGTDSFTYWALDGTTNSTGIATVTITVTPMNDRPVANNDAYSTPEDTTLNIPTPGVLANDSDADGDTLTAIRTSSPTHGTLTFSTNGSFIYVPAAQFNGTDSFTYWALDGTTNSTGIATVTITVTPLNDPPVAVNDSYTTSENTTLGIAIPGVLANDSDPDGDALSAIPVAGPAHGTLTLNANGSFSYSPATNYVGSDSFTYRANDGATNSGLATVMITVTPANNAPVAVNDSYTTPEDTMLNIAAPGVLSNDSDPDGDALQAALLNDPTHGTLTLSTNGGFNYTPTNNYVGGDSFTYRASDGTANSGIATVTIAVTPLNDPPVAVDDSYAVNEDTTLNVPLPGFLANDSDPDGDLFIGELVAVPSHGTLTFGTNGNFTYRPALNYTGSDSFTYHAFDGKTNGNIATVRLTINPVNDRPVVANDSYTTPEDTALNISTPGVLVNDSDVDGDPLTAILATGPAHGTITLSSNGGFSYVPTNHYNGSDSFTYRAFDGATNSVNLATVTITVTPLNDAPVAVNDAYTTPEDTALNIPAPGVLVNDSDVDGDPLTAILATGPARGTLTLNTNGSFTYTPTNSYNGPDSFTYRAFDSTTNSANAATVTITVTPVSDLPVAVNDTYTTPEDTTLNVSAPGVLNNDNDPDGDVLKTILATSTLHGTLTLNTNGGFSYTPTNNYVGEDSFTYRANDGTANSGIATVNIMVTPINDAPVAVDDYHAIPEDTTLNIAAPGILANDNDPDGDVLRAILVAGPLHGTLTLNTNGGFGYTPANNYVGGDSFTYRANDGATNSGIATVAIAVIPLNDTPIAINDSYTTPEDTTLTIAVPGVLANDSDADGDVLRAILVTGTLHGSLALSTNGSFSYLPTQNYTGPDSFTYRANDGLTNSGIATVNITVTPLNDAPVAINDSYTTPEDTTLTIATPGVLVNDSDPDGDTLSAVLVSNPTNGALILNTNGGFSYTPTNDFFGLDNFTYRASDGLTNSSVVTVTILVTPVDDPPDTNNWSGHTFSLLEDAVLTVNPPGVLAGITNRDLDGLVAELLGGLLSGTLSLNTNGSFSYQPATNFNGLDGFQFRALGARLFSPTLNVNLTVTPVNDPPSFTRGADQLIQQNTGPQVVPLWATNIRPGPTNELHETVTFEVSNDATVLFAVQPTVTPDGTLIYTPALNAYGVADVRVIARDDGGTANGGADSSTAQTFSITVNAPPTVSIASPTNGAVFIAPADFTVLADARDVDGTISKVEFFDGNHKLGEVTSGPPHFIVRTNVPAGGYTFGAIATDNLNARGTSAPVSITVIDRPPLTVLSALHYNPQTDFFEERVRVSNPTYSTFDAVRVLVFNLTNTPTITVHNKSGMTNDIPYIQTYAAVPPNSYVDMTIEYHSPLRVMPNSVLRAELVSPRKPSPGMRGLEHPINRGLMFANKTFMVEFETQPNRVYLVDYSSDLKTWKSSEPAVTGDGGWVQWIDNGLPKTDGPPAAQEARFYRVILLP